MIISKLAIRNYKSIKKLDLTFSSGKNIIVGQNNSGKSNIISAINLLLGERFPPKTFEQNMYHKDNEDFFILIELTNCSDFDITYLSNYNKQSNVMAINSLSDLKKSADDLEQEGNKGTWKNSSLILDMIQNSKRIIISLYSNRYEESIYSLTADYNDQLLRFKFFANDLLSSFITSAIIPAERSIKSDLIINNYSWYGKLVKSTWETQIQSKKETLEENNKNLSRITNDIFKKLTDELENSVKDAIAYNSLEFKLIQDTKSDFYKSIKILLDDGYYSLLEDKGSGIKSLIIIELFKLYCKKYHKSSSCLIIEEPEVFLHPQARRVLSKKIDQFLTIGNNQTILTTHSEQFLADFDVKQLVFISKENGESKAYKIEENDGDFVEKDYQKMNIITKTENAEMYFANTVILVEGGEKHILKSVIEALYNNLLLDYNNISIIAVGGKSWLSIYKKMLEKLNKKVFIFADYDNFKENVNEYLTTELLTKLNTMKSQNGGLKKYTELPDSDKGVIDELLIYLENKNIYYLKNGELEDYYNLTNVNSICSEERISGKEVKAHYIATFITKENINDWLSIDNDFVENINKILKKLEIFNTK